MIQLSVGPRRGRHKFNLPELLWGCIEKMYERELR